MQAIEEITNTNAERKKTQKMHRKILKNVQKNSQNVRFEKIWKNAQKMWRTAKKNAKHIPPSVLLSDKQKH